MTVICPKCSLVRPPDATNPDWQCPGCGICYAKFQNRSTEPIREERVAYVEEKKGWDMGKLAKVGLLFAFGFGVSTAFERMKSTPAEQAIEEAAIVEQLETDSGVAAANAVLQEAGADATLLRSLSGRLEKYCATNKYGLSESECIARIRENEESCASDVAARFPGKIDNVERMQEVAQAHTDCIFDE